jgi:serine/threonine protein kinase
VTPAEASQARVQRFCPSCDADRSEDVSTCAVCGTKLLEIRSQHDDLVGQVIDGRFEVRAKIGEGGMGAVYRAWQRSIGREVAIKIVDDRHVRDLMAARRFLREAKLASQLSQPSTVSIIDFGQSAEGRLFIAMELVKGRTLGQVVKTEGPFDLGRAVRVGVQLCDALEAAHNLSIVHRDLKPANVILLDDPPGRDLVKVLDFGLAKSLIDDETETTETGMIVGTPRFVAPEVTHGHKPGPRTDLYALGVMLCELCTGKRLFEGSSFNELMWQKTNGVPIPDGVPAALAPVLRQLIDPDPTRRFANAAETRAALVGCVVGSDGDLSRVMNSGSSSPGVGVARPAMDTPPTEPIVVVEGTTASLETRVTTPTVSTMSSRAPAIAPRRRRGGLVPIVIGVTALFAGAAALVMMERCEEGTGSGTVAAATAPGSTPEPGPSSPSTRPEPGPEPAAMSAADAGVVPATVDIMINASPYAEVRRGKTRLGQTPVSLRFPVGTDPITIDLTRKGYRRHRLMIVPDRAQRIDVKLERIGGGKSKNTSVDDVESEDLPF